MCVCVCDPNFGLASRSSLADVGSSGRLLSNTPLGPVPRKHTRCYFLRSDLHLDAIRFTPPAPPPRPVTIVRVEADEDYADSERQLRKSTDSDGSAAARGGSITPPRTPPPAEAGSAPGSPAATPDPSPAVPSNSPAPAKPAGRPPRPKIPLLALRTSGEHPQATRLVDRISPRSHGISDKNQPLPSLADFADQ